MRKAATSSITGRDEKSLSILTQFNLEPDCINQANVRVRIMAYVPDCVVCLQPYDNMLNIPRVLACGHSFCELCLLQLQSCWQPSSSSFLATNNNDDSHAGPTSGAVIRCPECGHRTKLPVGGQRYLPKNVELLRLLPSLIREPESSLPAVTDAAGVDNRNQSARCAKPAEKNGTQTSNSAHGAPTGAGRRDHLNLEANGGWSGSAPGGVGGIRCGSERTKSPKVGWKGRVDLNHSLETLPIISTSTRTWTSNCVVESWLLPCDLYSNNPDSNSSSRKDLRTWILPEKSIKLKRGGEEEDSSSLSSRFRVVNHSQKRELLWGEVVLEQHRSSNSVPVRLRQLTDSRWPVHPQNDDVAQTTTYEDYVLQTWGDCPHEVKTELLILFRVSLLSRGLCNVLGVWMNPQRNALFLVSQLPANQEMVLTWEALKNSFRSAELSPECKINDDWRSRSGGEATSLSLATETSLGKLGERVSHNRKLSSSVVEQMRLCRVGVELCSALWEAHSQGLIFGLLSPNCLVLDRFGSLMIDFNGAESERSSLHDATTRRRNVSSECGLEGGGCGSFSSAQEEGDGQNYRYCCWRYMSPEALSLLMNNVEETEETDRKTDHENSSGSSSYSFKKIQKRLTCKTDVWSLGCLLLELMSGKEHYEGYTFEEVLQKVVVERERPGDFLSMLGFPTGLKCDDCDEHADDGQQSPKLSPIKGLAVLLSKCFEYDPDERPGLDILLRNFEGLGWSNLAPANSSTLADQHLQIEQTGSADQKYWVLCQSGFVRDGYLDSWYGREDDAQESQRRLGHSRLDDVTALDGRELQPRGLQQKGSLEGHRDYVTALAVSGDYLLSASFDKTIRVWSLEDNELRRTLEGHSIVVMALAVDQTTFRCFSGDTGGKICAWSIGEDTAEPLLASWQDHDDWRYTGVASLAVSMDGILYSGSGDRTIKAWSLQNFSQLGTMEGHKGLVSALLVDGELLYSGSWDGTIRVWWRNDQSLVAVLGGGTTSTPSLGGVRTLCMSDSFLFVGRDSGDIQVWRDEECLTSVRAHDTVVSSLYVQDGVLYTGSWDEQIKAWKVDTFHSDPAPILERNCGFALSSIISDGNQLYAGLADRAVKVYSLSGETWEPPEAYSVNP